MSNTNPAKSETPDLLAPLLTPERVASLADLHPKTIKACIRRGEFQDVKKLRGRYRITQESYLDWLDRNTISTAEEKATATPEPFVSKPPKNMKADYGWGKS